MSTTSSEARPSSTRTATSPRLDARLLEIAPGARPRLWAAIACGFGAAILVIAGAYLTSVVIADVFIEGQRLATTAPVLAVIAALAVVRTPLLYAAEALAQAAARRVKGHLRADLTTHLFALGPAWTGGERTGELAGVLTAGLADIDASVTSFQPARVLAVAVPLLVLAVVLVLDPLSALVLLVTGPVLVLLLGFIGGRARAITDRRFAEVRYLGAFFLDMLSGLATLKAFGRSREQVDTIAAISRRYGDTTMEVLRTAFQTSLVLEWGGAVAVALVAVEISLRLMDRSIAFDRALAVLIVVPEFFLPLRTLATRYHSGAAGRSAAERAFAILDEPVPPPRTPAPGGLGVTAPTDIRFSSVGVTYPGRDVPALDGVDLVIGRGRVIALVGATGAGKSTIAALLLRFIAADTGGIAVGDVPLDDIGVRAWRAHVAWVPQFPHLFHGTVAENLRLAAPQASDDELRAAARQAGADTFIAALPMGYATPVGEDGIRLSGGQRQRLAIARAFLADAWLVVLDEATSHLDEASEAVIRDAVGRLAAGGRTVLVVSHRLRLASMADEVVVLDRGRVVESGRPVDLAASDGPYRRLLDAALTEDDAA